jgi:L-alanine-DL-glutamate epimerase-like enolase superfamily enzyme
LGELRIRVDRVDSWVFRCPIAAPVQTSFGLMRDRPAVLVRVTDRDGAEGWGEIWCNFPSVGAEHRARLLKDTVAPLLVGQSFETPADAYRHLDQTLQVLAIQSGEPGPISQCTAGLDIALWDLASRKLGQPLYRVLGGSETDAVPVYASGLNPDRPDRLAVAKQEEGFTAFKLKVGFGRERDLANLTALRCTLGASARLMVDANQAWDVQTAMEMSCALEDFAPGWLEEPIRADAPSEDWRRLRGATPIPLAAGENLRGESFTAVTDARLIDVLQPDIGKWGGLSGCVPVGRAALAAGLRLCPHWLGGGVGLVASLHFLAAVGGDGMAEVDANPNPLREAMATPFPPVAAGQMRMPKGPGLGIAPDLKRLQAFQVLGPDG